MRDTIAAESCAHGTTFETQYAPLTTDGTDICFLALLFWVTNKPDAHHFLSELGNISVKRSHEAIAPWRSFNL